jgi:ATP-binding cassette subfamily B (MDR/TAP) protein 1
MTTVLFCTITAGGLLANAAPFIAAVAQAGASASRIFTTIERPSPIDPLSSQGEMLDKVEGNIEFHRVRMAYPSRPNQTILDDFNLVVPAGKTAAVVGPSGSGKTTLFALLERLYLPLDGDITLDGSSVSDLNLRWFRSQIGFVSQDNFLFNTSIYDNIAYGLGVNYDKVRRCIIQKLLRI